MIIVVPIGFIITSMIYLFGFIFIIYILEKILISLNNFIIILNQSILNISILNIQIPLINSLNIQIFFLVLISAIIVLISNNDMTQHKNKNNEIVYRKEWQKLLDLVNIAMIYAIFYFYEKTNFAGSTQKIYMIGYGVLFLIVFIFSHHYTYINKNHSKFDKICFYIHKTIVVIASVFVLLLLLAIFSFFIYLHDFTNFRNIFISIIYYVFLISSTIIFSCIVHIFFSDNSENKNIISIISDFFLIIIFSIIIGFSSFYNLFIKNCSIFSIHSLIVIDVILMVLISIFKLSIYIINSGKKDLTKNGQ